MDVPSHPARRTRPRLGELLRVPCGRRTEQQLQLIADHLSSFGLCGPPTATSGRRLGGALRRVRRQRRWSIDRGVRRLRHVPAEVRAQVARVAVLTVYPPYAVLSTDSAVAAHAHACAHTCTHAPTRAHTHLRRAHTPTRVRTHLRTHTRAHTHLRAHRKAGWAAGKVRPLCRERAVPCARARLGRAQTEPAAHRPQPAVRRAAARDRGR
jgi:hypothetical protein